MNRSAISADRLSAALLEIEDSIVWDFETGLAAAVELERQAEGLGDELLVARARLCRANLLMRTGDIAPAARQVYEIHEWAIAHGDRRLQSRSHLACANVERLFGDLAKNLEHTLSAVELLDETATPFMQVWHRTKLADALSISGAMDAARPRYRQAEELARELGMPQRLAILLNNWAYAELAAGEFALAREVAGRLQEHAAAHGIDLDPTALDTIGAIQIGNGQYAEAEQTMLTCIALHDAGQCDAADDLADYFLTLARAQRGLGSTDQAQENLNASRTLCTERDLHEVLVRVYQEQAELHSARGEHAEAFEMYKTFHAAHESLRSKQREAHAQARQAIFETAEAREEAERFREQARRDPLTGLRNRRYVDEELPGLIAADPDLTVAIVDLDYFKRINDQLSHDVGDQVLVQVAKLLETELAVAVPDGFAARLGGEEFLMVLPRTAVAAATERLDGIRQAVRSYAWPQITGALPVTISIGVAGVHEAPDLSQPALLSTADRNLYIAKRAGRDRVVSGKAREAHKRTYRDLDAA
ncbi:diguanylate cyclase [Krasilnikovia sp. MM14-A1259]|uniref:GGDEF domain-containing protein n=1 Tax=Krasilnikovia sp. MM14-A1259 TaxID=3373539 RepID=UPI003817AAE9